MSTGDVEDIFGRLRGYLPTRWFGSPSDSKPIRDAVLIGFAVVLSYLHDLYAYAKLQTRLATMTDGWLDMFAADFFGTTVLRKAGESDDAYRSRIRATLFREKATRQGISDALFALTGRRPTITEAWRPLDTGGYAQGSPNPMAGPFGAPFGYNVAGSYGSLHLNAQFFVIAFRPNDSAALSNIDGYEMNVGGYNVGSQLSYASLIEWTGGVTDSDIYACVASAKADGTIAWVQIRN